MNKKWFCKQAGLPVAVFEEPYFSYFIELYKAQELLDTYQKEQSWIESNYHKYKDAYIQYVQNHPAYEELRNFNKPVDYSEVSGLFVSQNDNKSFTSYDMVEANLNVMRAFDPALVHNCKTWTELSDVIFHGSEFLRQCKYPRQVIFGNLLPKKQRLVQKHVMSVICGVVGTEELVMSTPDEIVLPGDHGIIKNIGYLNYTFPIRTTFFDLGYCDFYYVINRLKFCNDYSFEYEDIEIKCCEKSMYAQAWKQVNKLPINDFDKTFEYNGKLARYI